MEIENIYDRIYRYAYFKMRDVHAAEDITQETFLRYLNSKGTGGGYEMRYLYTIARNLCVDAFRKGREEPLAEAYEPAAGEDPAEALLTRLAVKEALGKMNDEDQELLLLRFVNGESVITLSKLYACSRFSIYRRLKRAEAEFRRWMGGEEP